MRSFEGPSRPLAVARHGMAATSHQAATLTAVEVLKAGGNAIDAAIAASAVQAVVEPGSTGVGGDCFAMISMGGSTDIRAYNGSGRAPAAFSADLLKNAGATAIARSSPHAVTVPGAVEAWCRLLEDFGRMSMAEVLQPAISMAREGYVLAPRVAFEVHMERDLLAADDAASATFLIDGQAPAAGSIRIQPLLADTLEAIGRFGSTAFYRGAVAQDIVEYLGGLGGFHTLADFAATQGEYVSPISTVYRGRTVYECPPNGQGVVALLILNILSRFARAADPFDPDRIHIIAEATRLAYAARDAMVADPSASGAALEHMLSDGFADHLAGMISTEHITDPLPVFEGPEHSDTIYLCVVDRDRNAVSFINSLFSQYGSGLMAPRSGVLLHNRGQGFSLEPGHPNEAGPRKRPLHTIIPGMVAEGGRVVMPFGLMGGHYQAMGHAHLLSSIYDCDLDLQAAIDLPRFFPLRGTTNVEAETSLRDRLGPELARRGFTVKAPARPIGGAQAILIDWDRGVLFGGSDPRKDGMALGY